MKEGTNTLEGGAMSATGRMVRSGFGIKPWMSMLVILVCAGLSGFFIYNMVQTSEASQADSGQVVIDLEPIHSVTLGETILLRAIFEDDPPDDNVTYTWKWTSGSIDPPGPCRCATVTYTAPTEPSSEVVIVFATWAQGQSSSYSVGFDIYSPG